MTIYAVFFENYKALIKGDYLKSFETDFSEKGLSDMLSAIKVNDDIVIIIKDNRLYTKVRFSSDFSGYRVVKMPVFNEKSRNRDFDWIADEDDYIVCNVTNDNWQNIIGRKIAVCNDRTKQIKLVDELDLCTFQVSDINELRDNLTQYGQIGDYLVHKMFFTDGEIAEMGIR